MQAVKDVYLPSSGLWVSEYPHADRAQFLDVSLQARRAGRQADSRRDASRRSRPCSQSRVALCIVQLVRLLRQHHGRGFVAAGLCSICAQHSARLARSIHDAALMHFLTQVERESQEVQQWGQQQPPQQPNEQPYEQQPSEGGSYGPAGAGSWQGDGYGQPRY